MIKNEHLELLLLGIYYLMLVYMYVIIDISIHTQNFQQTQFAKIGVGWVLWGGGLFFCLR